MGPSGCGKSTMLDTLAGRLAKSATWEGQIRVNGHKSRLSYGRAAYVTQVSISDSHRRVVRFIVEYMSF